MPFWRIPRPSLAFFLRNVRIFLLLSLNGLLKIPFSILCRVRRYCRNDILNSYSAASLKFTKDTCKKEYTSQYKQYLCTYFKKQNYQPIVLKSGQQNTSALCTVPMVLVYLQFQSIFIVYSSVQFEYELCSPLSGMVNSISCNYMHYNTSGK